MKIISWNVNGLRAVYKRGFVDLIKSLNPDILCLQEIKAAEEQLPLDLINIKGYNFIVNSAEKKGYSGVAVYTKEKPINVVKKLNLARFDIEGRMLLLEYTNFILLNLYIHHGGREKENLGYKLKVYEYLLKFIENLSNKNIILIGDFNIAHKDVDLARPKQNKNNIMFTEEEKKQLDKLISLGFIDTFRKFNKDMGYYTWWPYYANARERNLGWRIDYSFISKTLISKLKGAFILKNVKGSDHCPVSIDIS